MRVMLIDDDRERLAMLDAALVAEGHLVVARLMGQDDLLTAVANHQPEIILIDVDAPGRDTLETLGMISRDRPRPIVLFAAESDADTIRRAMQAGVSAYVVDGLAQARLKPVMNVAIARFHEYQALKGQLEEARIQLADRKDVERAKGLLMERRKLSEPEAFAALRKLAMDKSIRIGEAARMLIAAAELL